jgi:hypothetical protein
MFLYIVTRSLILNGYLIKTKITNYRNSYIIVKKSQDRARTIDLIKVKTLKADININKIKTRIIITIIINRKTLSSFNITELRSFRNIIIALRL